MSAAQSSKRAVVDEDVDDLDDVLEQFTPSQRPSVSSAPKTSPPKAAPTGAKEPAASGSPAAAGTLPTTLDDLDISSDFARELADGMAALMREIAAESGVKPEENLTGTDAPSTEEQLKREAEFRKAWEDIMVEGMNGALDTTDFGVNKKGKAAAKPGELDGAKADVPEDEFQASIRKAMDKLKQSDSELHADSADGADSFEALLASLGGADGEPSDELAGVLESMMAQLLGRDVLYDPLKELSDKFPKYLEDNAATLSAEDKTRYESQQRIVKQVLAEFDDPNFNAEDQERSVRIITLMNDMQKFGSPPAELMGPLPPGMEMGEDGLPKVPESCVIA